MFQFGLICDYVACNIIADAPRVAMQRVLAFRRFRQDISAGASLKCAFFYNMGLVMLFAFMSPGPIEILVVLLIVLLLFGAKRLPDLARSLGKSLSEFKKGREEDDEKKLPLSEDAEGKS